LTTRRSKTTSR